MVHTTVKSNEGLPETQPAGPSLTDPTRTSAPLPSPQTLPARPSMAPQLRDHARYDILGERGRGGLGRVSRAHDRELGRDIAIKELISRGHVSEVRMDHCLLHRSVAWACLLIGGFGVGCHPMGSPPPPPPLAAPTPPPPPPTLSGTIGYDNGTSAAGAFVSATSLATATHSAVAVADAAGAFHLALPPGEYALAVTANQGSALLDKQSAPDPDLHITLSRACHVLRGCTPRHGPATQISAERWSTGEGDVYYGAVDASGCFTLCIPDGYYMVSLTGDVVSQPLNVQVPATTQLQVEGFLASSVKSPPPKIPPISAELTGLIADIKSRDPTIIGMGEATHGTGEFTTVRGELSLALVRQADVQLLLFEVDAISATALDDYVNGGEVDIAKAVAALRFWVTDTYEFLHFLELVRTYNADAARKVHIWGVDLQNTELPVKTITGRVAHLNDDEAAALKVAATQRGKTVPDLPAAQRTALAALLSRLGTPQGSSRDDLLLAVAARSLALQLQYWDGDMLGHYRRRRDAGMAELAAFLTSQVGARRACLWAHDGHISKDGDLPMLGQNLARNRAIRYYGVGFYLYEGSTRAWDAVGKIGVIPHPIPAAAPYMVEGAVMRATGMPAVAWLPLDKLAPALSDWLEPPRVVREVGAVYVDDKAPTLRRIREAFDAIVVIRTGHDSTPTATGVRTAKHD